MCNRNAFLSFGPGRFGSVFIHCDFRYQKIYVFFLQVHAWKWRYCVRMSADIRKLPKQPLLYTCGFLLQRPPLAPFICPSREWDYQLSQNHFLQTKVLIKTGVFSQVFPSQVMKSISIPQTDIFHCFLRCCACHLGLIQSSSSCWLPRHSLPPPQKKIHTVDSQVSDTAQARNRDSYTCLEFSYPVTRVTWSIVRGGAWLRVLYISFYILI